MKVVIYGPEKRTGILEGDHVIDIAGALAKAGNGDAESFANLQTLIEGGRSLLDKVHSATENLGEVGDDIIVSASGIELHAPRVPGGRIACCGGNYPAHAIAMAQRRVERGEPNPIEGDPADYVRDRGFWGFWKIDRESLGHEGKMSYPERCRYLDYEGECAVVFGKAGKNIKSSNISDHVWGVTLLGDWSIRMSPEGGPLKFALQKNFDGCCSVGPCIQVGDIDFMKVEVETRVNGEGRQKFVSGDMAFSYGEYLEHLSKDFTFLPGDMISGGTAEGTAMDSSPTGEDGKPVKDRFLKAGDVVEISSPQIGVLRTHIV
jgi:2-keto-4-pentenoate hydratase/2-oxohepta-3-ene-1,7-dioic acid hydratase in catechol pathway